MHVGMKIALGVGIIGGGALLLAACGEKDPQQVPNDLFKKFDKDGNGVSKKEATIDWERTSNDRSYGYRIGDFVPYTDTVKQTTWTESMMRAHSAADTNNDALASWAELTALAQKHDKDGDGTLNGKERREFESLYKPQILDREVRILSQSSGMEYRPQVDYPRSGSGSGGYTSPGDDYGSGSGSGGYTSPGDDYGSGGGNYTPPPSSGGGSTSPGDSGGSYTPPPSSGGGSSSSGDSTDNGNPSYDDF
jgi:hypothetical protein